MDNPSLGILVSTAAFIGLVHTLAGPDHYVPFIAMAKVRGWSLARTMAITLAAGLGHVGSSILLGALGILLGWAVGGLEWFEGLRGDLAGWLLLGFGLAYMIWGLRQAIRNRPHTHVHVHADSGAHVHEHAHVEQHLHVHAARAADPVASASGEDARRSLTPWVLFVIFLFGPCEPLIPVLMYPAAQGAWWHVALVAFVFSACTIAMMSLLVAGGVLGLSKVSLKPLERYSHALAGFALFACGAAIKAGL
ncbi:MAG: hypothetical protein ACE148_16930 [Vicinamibacterales bacterium]